MSSIEGKSDVQVTRLGHVFPFGGSSVSPLPHLTQCCRFSVPERLPLQPFRQDRLQRLPLPPSLMAASSKTVSLTGTGIVQLPQGFNSDTDPFKKIVQLEKNIAFIQENHALILKSLHEEISELKQKNRELHFQIVTGYPALPPESLNKEEISQKAQEKMEKLEREIHKLRTALRDAMKTNSSLNNELQALKRGRSSLSSSSPSNAVCNHSKTPRDHNGRGGRIPRGPSPDLDDYSDTLRQIQHAASNRNSMSSDSQHDEYSNHYRGKGGHGYMENRRGHSYHHHHVAQQSHDGRHQPRLPRLPLRNQLQNYMQHNQYEFQQRASGVLPSLKQSEQSRQNKQRKPREPRAAKVGDHIYDR